MAITAALVLPIFMLYAFSGYGAALAVLVRPLPGPLSPWRVAATVGLWLLAFGTACDNLRTFAGGFAFSVPDGVFALRNSTLAAELLAQRGGAPTDLNYVVSLFCFFAHEVLGSTFILPGTYLWACAAGLPSVARTTGGSACSHACVLAANRSAIAAATAALCVLALAVGIFGFITHTATAALVLEWNGALGIWAWGSADENPFGLFGVFLSSGVWIVVGALLWWRLGLRWFFALQLVAFLGQGASAALGEAAGLLSNLWEQLVTWALLALGWQLRSKAALEVATETAIVTASTNLFVGEGVAVATPAAALS